MSNEQINEFKRILFEFVKRATSTEAVAVEVEALPSTARVLMDLLERF